MSEQEMNSYRFTSGTEPTDEMLEQIMREVARDARVSNDAAERAHWETMRRETQLAKQQWASRINDAING